MIFWCAHEMDSLPGAFEPAVWNFEKDVAGKEPAGFEFTTTKGSPAGKWVVKDDGGEGGS